LCRFISPAKSCEVSVVCYYGQEPFSADEHEQKINWTAQMFEQAQNDIVGFQAVFHSSSLEAAAGKAKKFSGTFTGYFTGCCIA